MFYCLHLGQDLIEHYESLIPIGTPVRFTFRLGDHSPNDDEQKSFQENQKSGNHRHENGLTKLDFSHLLPEREDDNRWPGFFNGGIEFPTINFKHKHARPYDHFWANGYGSAMPDR